MVEHSEEIFIYRAPALDDSDKLSRSDGWAFSFTLAIFLWLVIGFVFALGSAIL